MGKNCESCGKEIQPKPGFEYIKKCYDCYRKAKEEKQSEPKQERKDAGSRDERITWLALLKVAATICASNNQHQKVAMTAADVVKMARELEVESFGD